MFPQILVHLPKAITNHLGVLLSPCTKMNKTRSAATRVSHRPTRCWVVPHARAQSHSVFIRTTTTTETDVLAETPDRSMTTVLSTSTSKHVGCLDRVHQDVRKGGVPKYLLINRRHGTSGRPRRQRPNCRVRLRHAKTALRPLNRPARCYRRFPGRLPRPPWTKPCLGPGLMTLFLLLLRKKPRKDDSKNRNSSTS